MKRSIIFMISLLFLGSCEVYTQDEFEEQYVVETYLVANDNLSRVILSTSAAIEEEYKLSDHYVEDADVEIRLLNSDSTIAETHSYRGYGIYYPVNDSATVQPGRLYQLHITLPNGDVIESKTRVPGNMRSVNELNDLYYFQQDDPIEVTTTPSEYPGRQTYYVFTVNAVSPAKERLTPFFYDMVEKQGQNMKIYHNNSYGIMNEESYRKNSDGTITLAVPWLAVAFYGQNDITVNAIDDNMYDFLRTQSAQTEGASLLSGKMRNIEYNINGGIGIFGSLASDTSRVTILPPEE